jgi:hypothetical protein
VGRLSDIIDTDSGVHIILRTGWWEKARSTKTPLFFFSQGPAPLSLSWAAWKLEQRKETSCIVSHACNNHFREHLVDQEACEEMRCFFLVLVPRFR